jgi:serine/threonine-protein kinase
MSWISEIMAALKERRALQWLVAYLAAGWALTEATGFAIDNYGISRRVLDVVLFLLAVGLPTLLVLIWYHGAKGHQRLQRVEAFLLAALAAVAITGGLAIGQRPTSDGAPVAAVEGADLGEGSVAVLPFRNSVADPTLAWLDRGIAELISTSLAQIEDLRVVGGQRLFDLLRQEGMEDSVVIPPGLETRITQRAGARHMLTGAVYGTPDDLAITATLSDARTGEITASANARGSDVFALVDEISTAMLDQMAGDAVERGTLAPVAQLASGDLEAYSEYRRGRDALFRFLNREAIEHLERAVELDSTFALARFQLGTAYFQSGNLPQAFQNWGAAQEHLQAASERDRLFIEGMTSLQTEPEAGLSTLRELIRKYPEEKDARLLLASILNNQQPGNDESRQLLEEAIQLDPYYAPAYNSLAYLEAGRDNFERADSLIGRYVALEPSEPNPLDSRGEILEMAGRHEEAREAYRAALVKRQDFIPSLRHLAGSYLKQDRPGDAREELERFRGSPVPDAKVTAILLVGDTYVWEGQIEEGIAHYEAADEEAILAERPDLQLQPLTELTQAHRDLDRHTAAYEAASRLRQVEPLSLQWAFVLLDSLGAIGDVEKMRSTKAEVVAWIRSEPALEPALDNVSVVMDIHIAAAQGQDAQVLELAGKLPDQTQMHTGVFGWPALFALLDSGKAEEALQVVNDARDPGVFGRPQRFDPLPQRRLQYLEARAYEGMGDTAQAIVLYERFIDEFGAGVEAVAMTADAPERLARLRGGS